MNKPKAGRPTMLALTDIIVDERLQMRQDGLNHEQVDDIREAIRVKGAKLERVKVYEVGEPANGIKPPRYLVGGFHRYEGTKRAGLLKIECIVYKGTWSDAVKAAAAENQEHKGLHRTRADKRKAVRMMIDADKKLTNREIAHAIGVSHTFVNEFVRELRGDQSGNVSTPAYDPAANIAVPDTPIPGPVQALNGQDQSGNVSSPERAVPERAGREQEFRWADASNMIGAVVRQIDQCGKCYGTANSLEAKGLRRKLNEVLKEFQAWHQDCARKAKKAAKSQS